MAAAQLNLADRIAVRPNIVERCKAIVINYALYLLNNQAATQEQIDWASAAVLNAAPIGESVSWQILNHTDYLDTGSSISDAALTGAVEAAINLRYIAAAP